MKNKQDIDMASALAAMLEGDGRKLHVEVPTCPGDGSPWTIGYPGSIEKSVTILPVAARYKFEDICRKTRGGATRSTS
jgi:hypothetical protein